MRKLVQALKEELSTDSVKRSLKAAMSISVDSVFSRQLQDNDFGTGMADMVDGLRELGMGPDADKLEAAISEVDALQVNFNAAVTKQAKVASAIAQKFEKKARATWY